MSEHLGKIMVRIARVQPWYGSVRVVSKQGIEDGSLQAPKVESKSPSNESLAWSPGGCSRLLSYY